MPSLISQTVLINSLKRIDEANKFGDQLIPINVAHYITYIKITEITVYVNGSSLICVLRVPIPETQAYGIFKIQTIPLWIGVIQYKILLIKSSSILITRDREQESNLDTLDNCEKINTDFIYKRVYHEKYQLGQSMRNRNFK